MRLAYRRSASVRATSHSRTQQKSSCRFMRSSRQRASSDTRSPNGAHRGFFQEGSVAQLTHKQYDILEEAIAGGSRIAAYRRGTEYVVVPTRLRLVDGREAVEAIHPTTGHELTLYLDEI